MNNLAVIIPYHSTPAELESSLLSLLENRPENCEICVVLDQPYENIYELSEDEVHFLNVEKERTAEKRSFFNCMRLGLTACNSTYVYMMPAGVQFHSEWLGALDFMDQDEELKAFFLDPNLTQGGFFRKSFLDSFLQNSEEYAFDDESDAECFTNLVARMQEAELPCGLLKFEFTDEKSEAQTEPKPVTVAEKEPTSELETKPGPKPQVEMEMEPGPKLRTEAETDLEVEPRSETDPEKESEFSAGTEPVQSTVLSAKPGIWSSICALLRRFFKS